MATLMASGGALQKGIKEQEWKLKEKEEHMKAKEEEAKIKFQKQAEKTEVLKKKVVASLQ